MTGSALCRLGLLRYRVYVLDSSYENCDYEEGSGEPTFLWTKRNVDILTGEWPKVQEIRGKIDHIVEWLEAEPIGHFSEY